MVNRNERLPDFLIVGTMKSGTSTLARYLSSHEAICMSQEEIHYFDNDENFRQGVSWYSRSLMKDYEISRNHSSILVGEKTPTYSYLPKCPERIRETIPNTKLIWIFRDPVERTFSNFLHAKRVGAELLNFRTSIAKEEERIKKDIVKGYVERSKYVIQVERFLDYFSINQMYFMLFENLIQSPQIELNKVADFLGVSHFSDDLPQRHNNPALIPFSPFSLWVARKVTGRNWRNSILYRAVRKINYSLPRKKPEIAEDLIQQLEHSFEPYNQRLSNITGLNLEVWHSKRQNYSI